MKDWLAKHAIKNVWCQPSADSRLVVKPCRLSDRGGDIYGLTVSEHTILLPDSENWYHVFQIGLLDPTEVGMQMWGGWKRFDELLNTFNVQVLLYDISGRTFPLSLAYARILDNGNFVVATRVYEGMADFGITDLWVRFYAGHFVQSAGYNDTYVSSTKSAVMRNGADITAMLTSYQKVQSLPGYTFCYINGYPVTALSANNVHVWDYVEFIHDGLVREVYQFKAASLPTFMSTLDKMKKYILHPPKRSTNIDYMNDLEIQVFKGTVGRYYAVHLSSSLRQLTHRDWSISTQRIQDMITAIDDWTDISQLSVNVYIRRSGLEKPLVYEAGRIHELYKLSDAKIVGAMTGVNSTLAVWQAANLERSNYSRMMAARFDYINRDTATGVFGYNATAKVVADSTLPVVTDDGAPYVVLPPLLACDCTVFEYDSDRKLLGFYHHIPTVNDTYYCVNANAVLVEAIVGQGGDSLSVDYNATNYVCEEGFNHRFFTEQIINGVRTGKFEDVTGLTDYTVGDDGKVVWSIESERRAPVIWRDDKFLCYSFIENAYDGYMEFSIQTVRSDTGQKIPVPEQMVCPIVELWMNSRPLILGLDYFVEWPKVVVCNKEFMGMDGMDRHYPRITVRCRNQGTAVEAPQYGYVINGILSDNNRFDVRDDKVFRIIGGGKLLQRSDVAFREDAAVGTSLLPNGTPYCVYAPLVPLRSVVTGDTYKLRSDAVAVDEKVENYLSVIYPMPVVAKTNPIANKHRLFSPILNRIIHDLISNILIVEQDPATNYLSSQRLEELVTPYLYLLKFDPMLQGVDLNYVEVHPHDGYDAIELSALHFSVVARVNERYLNDQVVLNNLLIIKD